MLLFLGDQLAQSFGGQEIFINLHLEVESGEKVAIVGPNGIGKTSLLKIIAGLAQPQTGYLKFFKKTTMAYLSQIFDFNPELTVEEVIQQVSPSFKGIPQGELLKKFHFTNLKNQQVIHLSGGEKTRLQLACIWLQQVDLLLLDEPTNHLDAKHLNWLEEFIRDFPGTVIIVSHDRFFLDHTVKRVLELSRNGIQSYPGNYSAYKIAKQQKFDADLKTFFDQEKQIRKLDQAIDKQARWSDQAHRHAAKKAITMGCKKGGKPFYRAKAKKMDRRLKNTMKRLEHYQENQVERPQEPYQIDLSFTALDRKSKAILLADGIKKSFGSRILFKNSHFAIKPREKIGLIGDNGSGKTTLFKMILHEVFLDYGELWLSPTLKIGYLDQELQSFQSDLPLIEEISRSGSDRTKVRNLLADLLITGDNVFKPCSVLSMGEKVRAALIKLIIGSYDLLLLDEPTNFLDVESREKLEEALVAFQGAVIIVTHDRYLLEKVCQTIWSIENGSIHTYSGRYSEYIAQREKFVFRSEENDRLAKELRLASITGQLSLLDRKKNEAEYQKLAEEYQEILEYLHHESSI